MCCRSIATATSSAPSSDRSLVGGIASLFRWQAAFMVLIVPIVLVGLLALELKEPLRGGMEDRRAAEIVSHEKPPPFDRSVRTLDVDQDAAPAVHRLDLHRRRVPAPRRPDAAVLRGALRRRVVRTRTHHRGGRRDDTVRGVVVADTRPEVAREGDGGAAQDDGLGPRAPSGSGSARSGLRRTSPCRSRCTS